ncbi:MAG: hypothetical protein NVS3B20_07160 [Polyangiales bacterium]
MLRKLVIVDLDGPILDVSRRYFEAHQRALTALSIMGSHADAAAFWQAKRDRTPIEQLLPSVEAQTPSTIERYGVLFKQCIESDDLLTLDAVQPFALDALARLATNFDVVILSLRSNREGATRCVDSLGISALASVDFVAHSASGKVPRARALSAGRVVVSVVGDTEADAAAAKAIGALFVGMSCGIRSKKDLEREGASVVVDSLGDAVAWIERATFST